MDRWEAKRQAEAPPEPQFEMEIELEEAASDEPETVAAMVARRYSDDKIMDELNWLCRVLLAWKDVRAYRMEREEDTKLWAEKLAKRQRDNEYKQRIRDQVCKLQLQLSRLEGRTGVRREAIDCADYQFWSTSMPFPWCDCAEDCVGERYAKVLDAAWAC